MLDDALLMHSLESLGDPPLVSKSGAIWERLQDEKAEVSQNLVNDSLLYSQSIGLCSEASDETSREVGWRLQERLQNRLRQLSEAQDRLIEGYYGRCLDCGTQIAARRLEADPAAALCYSCQMVADDTQRYRSL